MRIAPCLTILAALLVTSAQGASSNRLLVAVDSAVHLEHRWSVSLCGQLLERAKAEPSVVIGKCFSLSDPENFSHDIVSDAQLSHQYSDYVRVTESASGTVEIAVESWTNDSQSLAPEFWKKTLNTDENSTLAESVHVTLANYLASKSQQLVTLVQANNPGGISTLVGVSEVRNSLARTLEKTGEKEDFEFAARSALATIREKGRIENPTGNDSEYSFQIHFAGKSNTVTPQLSEDKMRAPDLRAAVNVAGTAIRFLFKLGNGMRLHLAMEAYGDVAMVKSYALETGKPAEFLTPSSTEAKTDSKNYYYALGLAQSASMVLEEGSYKLGGMIRKNNYSSASSTLPNFSFLAGQSDQLADELSSAEVWISRDLSRNLRIQFSSERIHRNSITDTSSLHKAETLHKATFIYQF